MTTVRKSVASYPSEFAHTFRQALQAGRVTIACDSPRAARNLRSQLYAFREALYLTPEYDMGLALLASLLTFCVEEATLTVSKTDTDTHTHTDTAETAA